MPFDPSTTYPLVEPNRTEQEPVFSLRGLIAWLETQPPETQYCFSTSPACLLTRWHEALGYSYRDSYCDGVYSTGIDPYDENGWAYKVACGSDHLWTYGAALTRARVGLRAE